jgi:large subunit ribosomal protein L6
MSRIGKNPIVIPAGVTVEVKEGVVTVKGKLGELSQEFSSYRRAFF